MEDLFLIDPDIHKAETLPSLFYRDPIILEQVKEKIFTPSWQWITDENNISTPQSVFPFEFLGPLIDEPLLLTKDLNNEVHCISNVCTHRANLLIDRPSNQKTIVCKYHGRQFNLDGGFKSMPEFKTAENFPRPCDHLHKLPLKKWHNFYFTSIENGVPINAILEFMDTRIGFLPWDKMKADLSRNKEYEMKAHWALYCDNYLEGFHIPFVHNDLNEALDYGNYKTIIGNHCNLQIGYSDQNNEAVFDLPEGHVDYGDKIAAYYFWVFPNMMFNFYPWGLSINVVKPSDIDKTKVSFYTYVFDKSKLDVGAGSGLDKVELEDEAIVENVQKGIRSRFYKKGRFSPTMEKGVHHFHLLISQYMSR